MITATRWTIVQAAQAGDQDALRAICEKYGPVVVSYLRRRGLGDDAEDVAQETLLALTRSALERARSGEGPFRALVFAIARNQLLRHLERQGALKRGAGRVEPLGDRDAATVAPDAEFDREWLGALVGRALGRLGVEHPDCLRALQRSVLDGASQATVAQELGVTVEQVKKLVFRARRRVAANLRAEVFSYASDSSDFAEELASLARFLRA